MKFKSLFKKIARPLNISTRAKGFFAGALLMLPLINTHGGQSVTLAWDPSATPAIVGYTIYVLEENSTTTNRIAVGLNTQTTVTNLKEGLHYTFTVVAVNAAGMESIPSNEAIFAAPVLLTLLPPVNPGAPRQLQFQAAPGKAYDLQVSSDLKSWTTIWQSSLVSAYGTQEVQDSNGVAGYCFYRLKIH